VASFEAYGYTVLELSLAYCYTILEFASALSMAA
jgi:hypothetical protein